MITSATFALIRHGDYKQQPDTPSAWQPWPLTLRGREQSRQGVEELQEIAATLNLSLARQIYCSPLLRSWQTAQLLGQQLGLSNFVLTETEALTERSVGAAANLSIATIERAIASDPRHPNPPENWKRDPHYRLPLPGAESLEEAGLRVAQFLQSLVTEDHPRPELVLIVGHGASLRYGAAALGIFDLDRAKNLSMYHVRPVVVNCESGRWRHIAGEWKPRGSHDGID